MKNFVQIACAIALLLIGTQITYPCVIPLRGHGEEFRRAKAIFLGTVIEIIEDTSYVSPKPLPALHEYGERKRYVVKLRVERKYKGVRGLEISLYSFQGWGPCAGISFVKGQKYLVYAYSRDDGLYDGGVGSRTQKFNATSEDYRELNSSLFLLKARIPFL